MLRSDTLIPLTSGAYKTRNAIGNSQICENLFPEANPENASPDAPVTHYPREGLRALASAPQQAVGRGLFTMSNGAAYCVIGPNVYYITSSFTLTLLGQITTLFTPAYIDDNGTDALIVDGSATAFTITLDGNAFSAVSDTTGTYVGATRVSFSDTYLAMNAVKTNGWMVTVPNTVTFNALQQANADSTPDPIATLCFNLRQMWLLKQTHSEIWYLAGSTPFPYQEWPNIAIPYGCAAQYSLVRADVSLFWLSRNDQGRAIAVKTKGDSVTAISTRALEFEWNSYATINDCVGGTFQQGGHTFVIFHFPTADKTWAYDLATEQWHARVWIDKDGKPHRERVSFYTSVGAPGGYPETILGQDWQTGQIYALDPNVYTDNGNPIVCRRSFPHQMKDMKEITIPAFVADFATGDIVGVGEQGTAGPSGNFNQDLSADFNITLQSLGVPAPALCMRFSKNGGRTWSHFRQKKLISSGQYRSMMRYRALGMGRDWVFELMWVYPGQTALNGAYLDAIEHSA